MHRFGGFAGLHVRIIPEVALAGLGRRFQNQGAVQNTAIPLPESLSGLIERVTDWASIFRFTTTNAYIKRWIIARPSACISRPNETGCQL